MASPAFLLWSSSSTAVSSQENGNDDFDQNRLPPPPDPAPKDSSSARPKRKKASKATAPKRPPQRGLGIAQLERLRLQERWKMITEIDPALEIQPFPGHLPVPQHRRPPRRLHRSRSRLRPPSGACSSRGLRRWVGACAGDVLHPAVPVGEPGSSHAIGSPRAVPNGDGGQGGPVPCEGVRLLPPEPERVPRTFRVWESDSRRCLLLLLFLDRRFSYFSRPLS